MVYLATGGSDIDPLNITSPIVFDVPPQTITKEQINQAAEPIKREIQFFSQYEGLSNNSNMTRQLKKKTWITGICVTGYVEYLGGGTYKDTLTLKYVNNTFVVGETFWIYVVTAKKQSVPAGGVYDNSYADTIFFNPPIEINRLKEGDFLSVSAVGSGLAIHDEHYVILYGYETD